MWQKRRAKATSFRGQQKFGGSTLIKVCPLSRSPNMLETLKESTEVCSFKNVISEKEIVSDGRSIVPAVWLRQVRIIASVHWSEHERTSTHFSFLTYHRGDSVRKAGIKHLWLPWMTTSTIEKRPFRRNKSWNLRLIWTINRMGTHQVPQEEHPLTNVSDFLQ